MTENIFVTNIFEYSNIFVTLWYTYRKPILNKEIRPGGAGSNLGNFKCLRMTDVKKYEIYPGFC